MKVLIVSTNRLWMRHATKALKKLSDLIVVASLAEASQHYTDGDILVVEALLPLSYVDKIGESYRFSRSACVAVISANPIRRNAAFRSGFGLVLEDPFDPLQLRAYISGNVVKRQNKKAARSDGTFLGIEDLTLDADLQQAIYRSINLQLSSKEFRILVLLLEMSPAVVLRATIKELVWGKGFKIEDRSVDTYISRLRKKICDTPIRISFGKAQGFRAYID